MNKSSFRNSCLLFLAACIWGMAFVSQSKGMDYMQPFTFNGVRALIGAFVLFIYILVTRNVAKRKGTLEPINWKMALPGCIFCGIALTLDRNLQQFVIAYNKVGKEGFITTLYIIFVPIAGVFFGKRVRWIVWVAAAMAAAGMYLLCMTEGLSVNSGDLMVFLCAVVFTAHIMIVDYYSPKADGVVLSCIQFAICGIVCTVCALIWESPNLGQLQEGIGALLYAGVLSCGVAYTLQIVGQKGVNPTVAALIMSLESVVATIAGYVAFKIGFLTTDQTLTARQIAGCAIVFAAVILVQLPAGWFRRKGRT
ncbi:MAG: DMT family transporter [Lachnospiraceae bacterium]|nr:DMT family transporter [Lachnospiraceae bacterium]